MLFSVLDVNTQTAVWDFSLIIPQPCQHILTNQIEDLWAIEALWESMKQISHWKHVDKMLAGKTSMAQKENVFETKPGNGCVLS